MISADVKVMDEYIKIKINCINNNKSYVNIFYVIPGYPIPNVCEIKYNNLI